MRGIIFLWYGAIVNIPPGWALCDGSNGTPDLRDHFLFGAGLTCNPGDSQDWVPHTHPFTGDDHLHTIASGALMKSGTDLNFETTMDPAIGTTREGYLSPLRHALAYIMKLP